MNTPTRAVDFCKRHRITNQMLADALGVTQPAVSYKLRGLRPLRRVEINTLLEYFRRFDPEVTYEDLFSDDRRAA